MRVALSALLACLTLALSGCFNGLLVMPTNVSVPLERVTIVKADSCWTRARVALIDVDGMILNAKLDGIFSSGENPVSIFRERLDEAAKDPRVKAVVLRINSPGGAVTASDIMYRDLCRFRDTTGKPVVACLMDVAASGGYYLAVGSDQIIAHPTTVTGSIGVIMSLFNVSGLCHLLGVNSEAIKSGPLKDIGNPVRPMSDEERALLQGMVDQFYGQFVHVVAKGRKMPEDQVRHLADGRVFTGMEACKLGLVDRIGYLEDAFTVAMKLAGVSDAALVAYDRCNGYRGSIYAALPKLPTEMKIKLDIPGLPGNGASSSAAFLYLWEPGAR
jgi:protease-4